MKQWCSAQGWRGVFILLHKRDTGPRHLSPKQYGEDVIDSGQHAVLSMCSTVLHGERLFRISLIDEKDGSSGEKGESSQTN